MRPLLYLASQSPRRKEILKEMGISFKVVPSSYQEKPKKTAPSRLVLEHAMGKVRDVKILAKRGLVLGADTLVYCRGKILGKPKSMKQAFQMLSFISGRSHTVYTGVAIRNLADGKIHKGFDRTRVFIKKLSHSDMEKFFERVNPLDKAGAYAIQGRPSIVRKIEGSYSNVVGLPKRLVKKLIKASKKEKGKSKKLKVWCHCVALSMSRSDSDTFTFDFLPFTYFFMLPSTCGHHA